MYPQQQQQQQQQQNLNNLTMMHHAQVNQLQMLGNNNLVGSNANMLGNQHLIHQSESKEMIDIDKEKEKQARENHCEIERRRRVKMAAYFNELCVMVPSCSTLQRKPDKLTILRMASSHMRNLRGQAGANANLLNNDNTYKPSFLTDQELKHLILEAADGFLFVAQCDTGNIIYVSDAVQAVLSYLPNELCQHSLFEFVHPDDLEKVKDQLSTQENSSNNSTGRILDLKTGTVKKEGNQSSMRNHIGTRRSFICRLKLGQQHKPLNDLNTNLSNNVGVWAPSGTRPFRYRNTLESPSPMSDATKPQYSVLHITGYTKIWPPSPSTSNMMDQQGNMYHHSMQNLEDPNQALNSNFHLIAIARIQMTSAPTDMVNSSNYEFITRHDQNGVITFVDERVTALLGYEPTQMLKKNLYEFCIPQDQKLISDQFKQIYDSKISQPVQFTLHFKKNDAYNQPMGNASNNEYLAFNTNAYAFLNPCNDTFEFIVCTHTSQKYNELSNMNITNSVQNTMPLVNNLINPTTSSHLMPSQVDVSNSALSNASYMQYASMQNQNHYVPHVHQMDNTAQQQQQQVPVNIQLNYPTQMDPHGYMHQQQQQMQQSSLNSNLIPQNSHYGNYMMMQGENNFYGQ